MALIKCSECEKEVSDKATACPHCGAPFKKPTGCFAGGCLIIIILFAVVVIGSQSCNTFSSHTSTGGSKTQEPFPTDSATQQKLADEIARFETEGVFTKIRVVDGDQVWADVSDRFSKLTFEDKRHISAAIYSVYHMKQSSVNFVVLYDAYTHKQVGMYSPSYGLKLN